MKMKITRREAIMKASLAPAVVGIDRGVPAFAGVRGDASGKKTLTDSDYRGVCMGNMLRMGHCAPAVMRTILDISDRREDWPVRLVAGLPGGIGNTGFECGGLASPVAMLGDSCDLEAMHEGLPLVLYKGRDYLRRFVDCNKTCLCSEIQGKKGMMACMRAMRHSPEMFAKTMSDESVKAIPGEERKALASLYSHFKAKKFHCANTVFEKLKDLIRVDRDLMSCGSGFIGGTLFKGMTCGAFTAGVMAVGLALGEIENSRLRVIRMIALMMTGGDALRDDINKFNRIMNIGHRMSEWFMKEYGSTQCRDITRCDFSDLSGVKGFQRGKRIEQCRKIADSVARRVREIITHPA